MEKEKEKRKKKTIGTSLSEEEIEPTIKKKVEEFQASVEAEEEKPKKKLKRKKKKEPELSPEEQEILAMFSPEALSVLLRYVDGLTAKGLRIRPATDEELLNLATAWGVVAKRRLPAWLLQYGDIVMAVGITTICYGGRLLERIQEEKARKEKEKIMEEIPLDLKKKEEVKSGE